MAAPADARDPAPRPWRPGLSSSWTSPLDPVAWAAAFTAAWADPAGPEDFIDRFRPLLAPTIVLRQPKLPTIEGFEAFERRFVRPLFALLPDARAEVRTVAAAQRTVFLELTLRGTLAGGRPVAWDVVDKVTVEDGLAIERISYFDPGALLAAVARSPRSWPTFARLRVPTITSSSTRRAR
jgi:ketosteroid isomerase-like protein